MSSRQFTIVQTKMQCSRASALLPVASRTIAFLIGIVFADELSLLGAAKISFALEVVDVRVGIDPHQLVTGTRHAGRRLMHRRLPECPARRHQCAHQEGAHRQYANFQSNLHMVVLVASSGYAISFPLRHYRQDVCFARAEGCND
jgi:hypothetical protein